MRDEDSRVILSWYRSITFSSSVQVDWTERKNCTQPEQAEPRPEGGLSGPQPNNHLLSSFCLHYPQCSCVYRLKDGVQVT